MKNRILSAILLTGLFEGVLLQATEAQQYTRQPQGYYPPPARSGVSLPPRGYVIPGKAQPARQVAPPQNQTIVRAKPVPVSKPATTSKPTSTTTTKRSTSKPPEKAVVKKSTPPPPSKTVSTKSAPSKSKPVVSKSTSSKSTPPKQVAVTKTQPKPPATSSVSSKVENARAAIAEASATAKEIKQEIKEKTAAIKTDFDKDVAAAREATTPPAPMQIPAPGSATSGHAHSLIELASIPAPSIIITVPELASAETLMADAPTPLTPVPVSASPSLDEPAISAPTIAPETDPVANLIASEPADQEEIAPISNDFPSDSLTNSAPPAASALTVLDVASEPASAAANLEIPLGNLEPELALEIAENAILEEAISRDVAAKLAAEAAREKEQAAAKAELVSSHSAELLQPLPQENARRESHDPIQPASYRPMDSPSDLYVGEATLEQAAAAPGPASFNPKVGRMTINADRVTSEGEKNRAIFTGNVEILSTTFVLKSERVIAFMKPSGGMERVEADGEVTVRMNPTPGNPGYIGTGKRAVYNPAKEEITLSGWPKIEEGGKALVANTAETTFVIDVKGGQLQTTGKTKTVLNP